MCHNLYGVEICINLTRIEHVWYRHSKPNFYRTLVYIKKWIKKISFYLDYKRETSNIINHNSSIKNATTLTVMS